MKTLKITSILALLTIPLGTILLIGGNTYSEPLLIIGTITGLYSMHLLDKQHSQDPENTH